MPVSLPFLDDTALARIDEQLKGLSWKDGRETAGKTAAAVKDNEQADPTTPAFKSLTGEIRRDLLASQIVMAASRPREISDLIISRTRGGGRYGRHIDNPVMSAQGRLIRTDVSFTLFLSDPDSYEGGELVVHQTGVAQSVKGRRGHLLLYPSSSLHEVRPVTAGERIVCVGWIESAIADGARRDLLFELVQAQAAISPKLESQSREKLLLDKVVANLTRMWVRY